MKIVVATHNEGKLVEIRNILTEQLSAAAQGIELVSAGSLDLADPAETGVTFERTRCSRRGSWPAPPACRRSPTTPA